jgi:hypothetical protein
VDPAGRPGADRRRSASGRPRYRNLWIGLAVLGGLGGLFAGVAAWQMGALGSGPTPLTQLRQRLGIGPGTPAPSAPPAAPDKPAAPSSRAPSSPAGGATPSTAVASAPTMPPGSVLWRAPARLP